MWVDVGNVVESEEENFVGAEVSVAWMLLSRPKDPHRHCAHVCALVGVEAVPRSPQPLLSPNRHAHHYVRHGRAVGDDC